PGVAAAGLVNTPPLGGKVAKRSLDIEGLVTPGGEAAPLFWLNTVTAGYFRAMGITLLSGSPFTEADVSGQSLVAIVDARRAERFWPGQNHIGKPVRFVGEQDWRTVVGVVADVRAYSLQQIIPGWIAGTLYVPYSPRATLEDGRVPAEMTLAVQQAAGGALT